MKLNILGFFLFLSSVPFCQSITIEQGAHPFFDVFEWKGMGAILMSKDLSGNSKQINLTLVGKEQQSIWDQKFTPKNEDYYFISSENARYVYFLHNLKPEAGKIYFSQLNEAGNVKATSAFLSSVIKKLGDYNLEELELKNIIVTDKALIHHFRYYNKKEKSFDEIATFMTHHNMLVYAALLGSTPEEDIKSDRANHWRYSGFDGDKICFSKKRFDTKSKCWLAHIYSSKGELTESKEFIASSQQFSSIENTGFGTTGSYYLKNNADLQNALLTYQNNQFYFSGISTSNNQYVLEMYLFENNGWVLNNVLIIEKEKDKRTIQLGVYPLKQGLSYHYKSNAGDNTAFLPFNKSNPNVHPFSEKIIFNPSRVMIEDNKTQLAVMLPSGNLYFELNQLNNQGSVEFEFIQKK
jgi:hypothetical protein